MNIYAIQCLDCFALLYFTRDTCEAILRYSLQISASCSKEFLYVKAIMQDTKYIVHSNILSVYTNMY